jgi:hypothetical protein
MPRGRLRTWFDGGKPDPAHAIDTAETNGWLDAQPGERTFEALALLHAWVLAGGGIASSGVLGDHHCRAIGWDDKPIEGLYVAGNSMARMDNGAFMQSGITNARGLTNGYLAGRHAAGQPSDLLHKAIDRLGL